MARNRQVPGDWNVVTDCCGRTRKFSECLKQWDGLIVCPDHYDPRHPLDFIKATHDDQRVPVARPQSTAQYLVNSEGTVSTDNQVSNGTFASDTVWVKETGWTIADGVATCDGTQSNTSDLFQNASLSPGLIYEVTFTLSSYSAGELYARCGADGLGTAREANGTYVERIACIGNPHERINFEASSDFVGSIDTVTVYLVTYS